MMPTPNASSSDSSLTSPSAPPSSPSPPSSMQQNSLEERRPEAEPMPSKRGEIGYRADLHGQSGASGSSMDTINQHIDRPLPARHPADRDPSPPTAADNSPITTSAANPRPNASSTSLPTDSSSTRSIAKYKKRILCLLIDGSKHKSYGGLHLTTLLILCIQLVLLSATIITWVFVVRLVKPGPSSGRQLAGTSSVIFVHVVFAVAVLGQLLFLERRIFRLRAERYAHLHPGEILPTSLRRGHTTDRSLDPSNVALAPWNRPPLPTYAAVLAQSGFGTGDVEDHLIAAPPPPAYGHTRGSTLLLSGFLRESLRAQRPRESGESQMTQRSNSDRPMSYEVVCDADRARQLEETLSRLERPVSRTSGQS